MRYELPVARSDKLGGIKLGDDFDIENDGTLNIKNMSAMQEQVQNLSVFVTEGKRSVASAITEKGVETEENASFSEMAENIRKISGTIGGIADYTESIYMNVGVCGIATYEE